MNKLFFSAIFSFFFANAVLAQVTVSPGSITAYSQGATSAYLTFSNVVDLQPAEAFWCGEVIPAAPDIGSRCASGTIFGALPARYDQSRLTGTRYTDIMSITPTVARRAYTDAVSGSDSRFFYVRRFIGTNGNPDQFIAVTIRLSGNGAGVPFSLTGVKLLWQNGEKVLPFINPDDKLPQITAEIRYTGTGRLQGRWEIVKPGDTLPERRDLLSEAALPPEERGSQKRYTLLNRFSVNLPPGGKYTLPGPENRRIDKSIEGMYVLLFRIEASGAPNSASNAGAGSVQTGAVAGFSMPTLRYYVGNSSNTDLQSITKIAVSSDEFTDQSLPITLRWKDIADTKFYRVEILDEEKAIFSAIVLPPVKEYKLPPFIRELAASKQLRWKTFAIGEKGETLDESGFSNIK